MAKSEISYPNDGNKNCYAIENISFWFRQRNKLLGHLVTKFKKDGNFVDLGGGNGFVSLYLEKKIPALNIILVEPGKEGCENAISRGVGNVIQGTLESLPQNFSLSNVGLFDVVEHIRGDFEFLKEIFKRMDTGSRLFITVPAYKALWSQEDMSAGHFRRYTKAEISKKCSMLGFKKVYSSYFFLTLVPAIFIFRSIPYLFGKKDALIENEHRETFLSKIIEKMLSTEIFFIKMGLRFPFGASIVLVLEK